MHPINTLKKQAILSPFESSSRQYCSIGKLSRCSIGIFIFCTLLVQAHTQNLSDYFVYKVLPGETFASIASLYNVSPKALAQYNNLDYYEGTLRSKTLRIPLKPKVEKLKKTAVPAKVDSIKKAIAKKVAPVVKSSSPPAEKAIVREVPKPSPPDGAQVRVDTQSKAVPPPVFSAPPIQTTVEEKHTVIKDTPKATAAEVVEKSAVKPIKKESSFPPLTEILPLLIFLLASIILLIAGIYFYRAVRK